MIQKISIFTYLWLNNLRNLILDFIATFTFDILINDWVLSKNIVK